MPKRQSYGKVSFIFAPNHISHFRMKMLLDWFSLRLLCHRFSVLRVELLIYTHKPMFIEKVSETAQESDIFLWIFPKICSATFGNTYRSIEGKSMRFMKGEKRFRIEKQRASTIKS